MSAAVTWPFFHFHFQYPDISMVICVIIFFQLGSHIPLVYSFASHQALWAGLM